MCYLPVAYNLPSGVTSIRYCSPPAIQIGRKMLRESHGVGVLIRPPVNSNNNINLLSSKFIIIIKDWNKFKNDLLNRPIDRDDYDPNHILYLHHPKIMTSLLVCNSTIVAIDDRVEPCKWCDRNIVANDLHDVLNGK